MSDPTKTETPKTEAEKSDAELTEAELNLVAGGGISFTTKPPTPCPLLQPDCNDNL